MGSGWRHRTFDLLFWFLYVLRSTIDALYISGKYVNSEHTQEF